MKIFTIANVKGGVAKSTSAAHLSMSLARRGRTLAVDHDPQADLSDAFFPDEPPEFFDEANVFTVIRSETTLKESIRTKHGVDILTSAMELEDFQFHVSKNLSLLTKLREVLRKSDYDFIVIDTPGSGSAEMLSAFLAADSVIIPANPSKWAVRTIKKVFRKINEAVNFPGSTLASVSILPTIWGKSGRSEIIYEQLQQVPKLLEFLQTDGPGFEQVPIPVILPPIPQSTSIRDRTEFGEPLKEGTEGWLAYDLIADFITEHATVAK
ncbi:ParA family protein [Leptospira langatensis]|uniref:ParA family protein n=1 Tax=Leptospira langatensis TaxID=2484983 RepID=A0A5R2AT13_9LEPT|nr:ParA family protein [Leptospira langatensis]TGJ99877.1 ParA family protein [Leptospira langatensis]